MNTTTSQTFANKVSRHLRNQGVTVLASGSSRSREGVRVQRGWLNTSAEATVFVDLDNERHAARLSEAIADLLTRGGYTVDRNTHDATILYVTREG